LSFFERAWASRRTEVSVFDVVTVLELVRAQPFDKVYPSDLYIIGDSAYAVRRSVHAYDVVPIIDYVLISRVPAVHVYDIVPTYDLAYVARRNIVHAYDVIVQLDAADKSGNVTLSATDILSTPEWFFRVSKAIKIFEAYIPFELATASAVHTIFAEDLSVVYDLGASINTIKTVYAFDKLVADSISYTKSYSPLFFSILRRKVPIVYKTLSVLDTVAISERVNYTKSYNTLFFSLFRRRVPVVYKTLSVFDVLAVADSLSITVVKTVPASDYVVFDSVAYTKSYSPLFFSLLRRRVPIRYLTLGVADVLAVADTASPVKIKSVSGADYVVSDYAGVKRVGIAASDYAVSDYGSYVKTKAVFASDYIASDSASTAQTKRIFVSDYVVFDSASYVKSYSPLFLLSLQAAIPVRYLTLDVADVLAVSESASVSKRGVVSASDYIIYDYVPHMSPDHIRYRSLYANVGMRTISVFDKIMTYEHVWVGPRVVAVHARDYLVSDGAVAVCACL